MISTRRIFSRDGARRFYSVKSPVSVKKILDSISSNIGGYTRVLIVFMGIMCIVVIVAEQTIAQNTIILNVLPPEPPHKVYSYPLSIYDCLKTPKQLFNAHTDVVNIYGSKGCGKSEFVRQYCELFLEEGPHFYYKAHKLSNRRNCQVFVINAKTEQTLRHSLSALNAKLRQNKSEEGESENHKLIDGIKDGLKKQSRWLLVFEDASPDLDIGELLKGYEDWGDGQIIITSESPIHSFRNVALTSLIPRITAEKLFFSIAPSNDLFDPATLQKLFEGDLRCVATAAHCIELERGNGNDFNFDSLQKILSKSNDPKTDVIKLYCALLALEHPKLLFALDFIGKLPSNIPLPYKYIKHHMDTNMYDTWMEPLYSYSLFRHSKAPKKVQDVVVKDSPSTIVDPNSLSFFARKRHEWFTYLGLDPARKFRPQFEEMVKPPPMEIPEDMQLTLLKKCLLLKYESEYGGHVKVFSVSEDIHNVIKTLHTELTAPLLEASMVLDQDLKFSRTWVSKLWSFQKVEQTIKSREAILGKHNVHADTKSPDECETSNDPIYDSVLIYKAGPISPANLDEFNKLHSKQALKSIMAFVDATIPNTVEGSMESILLHGHLNALAVDLPAVFDGLAETCALHLKSELGKEDLESEFRLALAKAVEEDPKGPSHASALHRYAIWLHNNSRNQEAKELLDDAVKFADSLALNRTMAQVCCELGMLDIAQEHLELATRMVKPGDQDILGPLLTDLGQVLLLRGKTIMGIKYLQSAIEGFKNQVGTENPEFVRALNVVSIGHLMLGDSLRSNRARNEASSVLVQLKKKRLIEAAI